MAYTKVCTLDELAVGTARFVQLDEPLCLVRTDEQTVHAVHDTCSHQEYPLHEGWVENGDIECALHGSMFDLETGAPDALPAVRPIPVYACKIEDDGVWVDPDQQLNDADVPRH